MHYIRLGGMACRDGMSTLQIRPDSVLANLMPHFVELNWSGESQHCRQLLEIWKSTVPLTQEDILEDEWRA